MIDWNTAYQIGLVIGIGLGLLFGWIWFGDHSKRCGHD